MSDPFVSVVLPVHDQADHIAAIVEQYQASLLANALPYELVLVANACRDRSPEICDELAVTHQCIRVVHTDRKGWGVAVKLGLAHATGDLLCFTNSARTSPEELSLLVATARRREPVVVKARREIRERWQRRLGSLLYNLECRMLLGLPFWDVNGTPKVFPRRFEKLLHLTREDDLLDAEFCAVAVRERYPMIEVPIRSVRRHSGRSTTNYQSAWRMYAGAYRLARQMGRVSP